MGNLGPLHLTFLSFFYLLISPNSTFVFDDSLSLNSTLIKKKTFGAVKIDKVSFYARIGVTIEISPTRKLGNKGFYYCYWVLLSKKSSIEMCALI